MNGIKFVFALSAIACRLQKNREISHDGNPSGFREVLAGPLRLAVEAAIPGVEMRWGVLHPNSEFYHRHGASGYSMRAWAQNEELPHYA